MIIRNISEEIKNPNSLTAKQIFAALFYSLNLELAYEEWHAIFLREFFKTEEIEWANYVAAKNYFAWKEQQETIRDAIDTLKQERKSPENAHQFKDKAEKDLINYLTEVVAKIETLQQEIKVINDQLKDFNQSNDTWNTKINNVVSGLVGPDGKPLNESDKKVVENELKSAPTIATTLAILGQSYQKDKEGNANKMQSEAKKVVKFAPSVLELKVVFAVKNAKKRSDEEDNLTDFKSLITKNKHNFKKANFTDAEEATLNKVFLNGPEVLKNMLALAEKKQKLVESEGNEKIARLWLDAVKNDKSQPAEKSTFTPYGLFPKKTINKQASNDEKPSPTGHPIKKQE